MAQQRTTLNVYRLTSLIIRLIMLIIASKRSYINVTYWTVLLTGLLILAGCIASSSTASYIATYEVDSPGATDPQFLDEAVHLGEAIAGEIGRKYVVVREMPGNSLEADLAPYVSEHPVPNVGIDWNRQNGLLFINITAGTNELSEISHIREAIERILNRNNAYKWKFYLQNKRSVLY